MHIKPGLILIVASLQLSTLFGQDVLGRWYGLIKSTDDEAHYLIDIRAKDGVFYGYLDLPSSDNFRLVLSSLKLEKNNHLNFTHHGLAIEFRGVYDGVKKQIAGILSKDGIANEIRFVREPQTQRVQTIAQPIPYLIEEITFKNKDSTQFSGTLSIPQKGGKFPAVVLISGSGPQNRDEEILGHKPFKILADYLCRRGIAVLRYDDRGYARSGGNFRPATSLDYADDALAATQYLLRRLEIDSNKIGLIGHSEGGNIAPVVAVKEPNIDFIILLAAPGVSNFESYMVSLDLILQSYPETYHRDFPFFKSVYRDMATIKQKPILKDSLFSKFSRIATLMSEQELAIYGGVETYIMNEVARHSNDWYHHYLQFDVTPYLEKLKIPLLALNGDKDTSVEPKVNLNGIKKTLERTGNANFECVELKNVNHFFQESESSSMQAVYFNEVTFSKVALLKIGDWIGKHDLGEKFKDKKLAMLNDEIKEYIDRSVLCWLATSSAENIPNVSPKEVFAPYGENHIIVANIASPQTIKNIKQNSHVCISFIDVFVQKGFQIKGTAELIERSHPTFKAGEEILVQITKGEFPFSTIIKISVNQVKRILAPRYILFPETTEEEQILSAKKAYKV